jgi:hypothetical protein
MWTRRRRISAPLLIASYVLMNPPGAAATPMLELTADVTTECDVCTYTYTIESTGMDSISELFLLDLGPVSPTSISSPAGWSVVATAHRIDWYSLGLDFDVAPGAALTGFSYVGGRPKAVSYVAIGADVDTGDFTGSVSGATIGTGKPVPEPTVFGMWGMALAFIAVRRLVTYRSPARKRSALY